MRVCMIADLPCSQNDGGELRAVTPLSKESECECLDEDGRDTIVPLPLRQHGPRCPHLYIRSPVGQFITLKLEVNTSQAIKQSSGKMIKNNRSHSRRSNQYDRFQFKR